MNKAILISRCYKNEYRLVTFKFVGYLVGIKIKALKLKYTDRTYIKNEYYKVLFIIEKIEKNVVYGQVIKSEIIN